MMDEEERGTKGKEERGGRSDKDERATRRVKKMKICEKMKNEKVALGRIVDLRVLFPRSNSVVYTTLFFFSKSRGISVERARTRPISLSLIAFLLFL